MKGKIFTIELLLIFSFFMLFATPNKNVTFSIEPFFGFQTGTIYEYVFEHNSKTQEEYCLSMLEWKIDNALFFGTQAQIQLWNFAIAGNIKAFSQGLIGRMYDSDWTQDFWHGTGNTDIKTNYSEHDLYLVNGLSLASNLKYNLVHFSNFIFSPIIGISYEDYYFSGQYGFSLYGNDKNNYNTMKRYYPYDDYEHNTYTQLFEKEIIDYQRNDTYVWLGFESLLSFFNQRLIFTSNFSISPYTYIVALDSHLITGTYYLDICQDFFNAVNISIKTQFNFTKNFALAFTFDSLSSSPMHGTDYTSHTKDGSFTSPTGGKNDIGGASSFYSTYSFSLKLTL